LFTKQVSLQNFDKIGMPIYLYEAIDEKGILYKTEMQALNKEEVIEFLVRQKLTPVSVYEKGKIERERLALIADIFETVSPLDKILLAKHLAAVLKAGLSLREALEIMIADAEKPMMKKVLISAKNNLEKGQPLSSAFAAYPKYFSDVFVGMIRAGEVSGTLDKTLDQLGEQMLRDYDLVKKTKSAMIYPIILMTGSLALVIFLLTFVLPKLATAFARGGFKLPLVTRIFLAIGDIFSKSPVITFGLFISAIVFLLYFRTTVTGRKFFLALFWKIPLFRNLMKKIALVRFTRTLQNLLNSGMNIIESLEITATSISNEMYRDFILKVKDDLRRGLPLTESFKKNSELFPNILTNMMAVGERTGTLENILATMSGFYDEEVDRTLKNLVALMEPLMLLVMGIVVGGLAISILVPIYQMVGSLR